jgi:hypothetical protein
MGLEELEKIWDAVVEFYGDRLAHPDIEPRRFAWQLKIFKHIRNINNNGHNPNQ